MKIGYWLGLLERVLLDANQNKTQTRKDGLASGDGDPLRKAIQSKCTAHDTYSKFRKLPKVKITRLRENEIPVTVVIKTEPEEPNKSDFPYAKLEPGSPSPPPLDNFDLDPESGTEWPPSSHPPSYAGSQDNENEDQDQADSILTSPPGTPPPEPDKRFVKIRTRSKPGGKKKVPSKADKSPGGNKPAKIKQTIFCEICGRSISALEFNRHQENHGRIPDGTKNLKCSWPNCDRMFAAQSSRRLHIQSFHKNIHHECPNCQRQFTYKKSLINHQLLKVCSNNPKIPIPNLEKAGEPSSNQETGNQVTRNNQNQVFCPICGNGFLNQERLYMHNQKQHKKTITCECGKTFTRTDSYKSHLANIHGVGEKGQKQNKKKYKCQKINCRKVYNSSFDLRLHLVKDHQAKSQERKQ